MRSPTAASEYSDSQNLGLADWQLSGNRYGRFGSEARIRQIGKLPFGAFYAERQVCVELLTNALCSTNVGKGREAGTEPARFFELAYKLNEPVAQNVNNDIKARRIELVFLNECVPLGDLLGIRRKLL